MANSLDRFKKTLIGSKKKDSIFTDDILSNASLEKLTGINAIVESWRNILLTPKRTYDHDPEFGSRLKQFIFDPNDEQTKEAIVEEIKTSLMTYDNRGIIKKIDITPLSNMKGYKIDINVKYKNEEKTIRDITITE